MGVGSITFPQIAAAGRFGQTAVRNSQARALLRQHALILVIESSPSRITWAASHAISVGATGVPCLTESP